MYDLKCVHWSSYIWMIWILYIHCTHAYLIFIEVERCTHCIPYYVLIYHIVHCIWTLYIVHCIVYGVRCAISWPRILTFQWKCHRPTHQFNTLQYRYDPQRSKHFYHICQENICLGLQNYSVECTCTRCRSENWRPVLTYLDKEHAGHCWTFLAAQIKLSQLLRVCRNHTVRYKNECWVLRTRPNRKYRLYN